MPIITYAQNLEDVMLWRALGHIPAGFYIDIGAQDPIVDSVSMAFYEKGWRGVHVEPSAYYADRLRGWRPGETVWEKGIANHTGKREFYIVSNQGLSTADPALAKMHEASGFSSMVVEVDFMTLDYLLDQYADREIHWMKIDIEGLEEEAIRSWVNSPVRPWILVIESTKPASPEENYHGWEPLILAKGYQFAYGDGLNRFYISEAHRELAKALRLPANYLDGFVRNADLKRLNEIARVTKTGEEAAARHAEEVKVLQQAAAEAEAKHGAELQQLKQEAGEAEALHGEKASQLQQAAAEADARHATELAQLKKEAADTAARHADTVTSLQQAAAEMQMKHGAELERLRQEANQTAARHAEKVRGLEQMTIDAGAKHVAELARLAAEAEAAAAAHRDRIEALGQALHESQAECARMRAGKERLGSRLQIIYRSRFWKWSALFRRVLDALGIDTGIGDDDARIE